MIPPRRWMLKGPGLIIPVFFLSSVTGQVPITDPLVKAAGGCFASRTFCGAASLNQAGLGWISGSSVSLQHSHPFLVRELAALSFTAQAPVQRGGFGTHLSTIGITGYRQSSIWIAYGMKIQPSVSLGVGLHFTSTRIGTERIHQYGAGCALGVRIRIAENLYLGGHLMAPQLFQSGTGYSNQGMTISSGCSYTFFGTATYHLDLHITADGNLRCCHGLEVLLSKRLTILLGIRNRPNVLSFGIYLPVRHLRIAIAAGYRFDTGITPSSSLTYVR